MPVIRTPDERFNNLPDFPYQPHYVEINGVRVHFIDEGKGEVILCLHGEPSWSFLYRKMIPILARNHRVLAMDFIGFGCSDKFFRALLPTAKDQPEIVIEDAGHFLQEEKGEEIAQYIVDFMARTPLDGK